MTAHGYTGHYNVMATQARALSNRAYDNSPRDYEGFLDDMLQAGTEAIQSFIEPVYQEAEALISPYIAPAQEPVYVAPAPAETIVLEPAIIADEPPILAAGTAPTTGLPVGLMTIMPMLVIGYMLLSKGKIKPNWMLIIGIGILFLTMASKTAPTGTTTNTTTAWWEFWK